MKQKVLILSLCLLFIAVTKPSFAQEEMMIDSPTPAATATPAPNYNMPYPGILPDNPLYGVKTLRDKIVSIMIGDPLKKAEFNSLQADKRIGAALLLIKSGNKDKQELALSTISKGQNYYEDAIAKTMEAKKQGAGISEIVTALKRSGEQHIYELKRAKKTMPQAFHQAMDQLIARSQKLYAQVKGLK